MIVIRYATRETEGTANYIAFGEQAQWLPVYRITERGLIAEEIQHPGVDPYPITWPAATKFVYPIRISRERQLTLKTILARFGGVFDREGNQRDFVFTRHGLDPQNAERRFIS